MKEKELKVFLIKRFILMLTLVSFVEFIIITVISNLILPLVMKFLLPELSLIKGLSGADVLVFSLVVVGYVIIAVIDSILPSPVSVLFAGILQLLDLEGSRIANITGDSSLFGSMSPYKQAILFFTILVIIALLVFPYLVGAGYYVNLIVSEFDKIEKSRAEEEKKRNKEKSLMISNIAHDLKTPMTTVIGYSEALKNNMVPEDQKAQYLEAIQLKSERMNEIIQLLYDYVRVDSAGFELVKKDFDICEMLRECIAIQYSDIENAGMITEVDIPEEYISINADKMQLSRVIYNLINNAIRHNRKGDGIGLFLKKNEDDIRILVADTGKNIPPEIEEKLFEPFVMGDESRNTKGGSGLGLFIVKNIVEMHEYKLKLVQYMELARYRLPKQYTKAFVIIIPIEI